jgi:hypothetical protein
MPYHIYSSLNPRLVLDMVKTDDGYKDLTLLEWNKKNSQNIMFKHVKDRFYHILSYETG